MAEGEAPRLDRGLGVDGCFGSGTSPYPPP